MIVNKNSWHYKFWEWTYPHRHDAPYQTNLCSYFHRIFWNIILFFMIGTAVLAAVVGLLYGIFYFGFYQHTGIAFIVLGAIVAFVGFCYGWVVLRDTQTSNPGLVAQWVSAKKNKVCPVIQFEETNHAD